VRFGWRVKILPGVRVGSRGVRVGPRAVGLRVSRKSASITGGVGPVYYSTHSGRRRRKPARNSGVGCWAVLGILMLIGLAVSLVVVTYGLILIPVVLIGGVVLWARHRGKQDSMAREAERQAREGRPLQGLLSARLVNLLSRHGITTENQLREVRDEDLLSLPGFGLQSLAEVTGALPGARPAPPPGSEALNHPPPLPPASVRGRAAPHVASEQVVRREPPETGAPINGALSEDGMSWWDGYNWRPINKPPLRTVPTPEVAPPAARDEGMAFDRRKWRLEYMGEFRRVAQEAAEARGETVSEEELDGRALRLKEAAGNQGLRERLLPDGRWKYQS
jgi:hypothetical protein